MIGAPRGRAGGKLPVGGRVHRAHPAPVEGECPALELPQPAAALIVIKVAPADDDVLRLRGMGAVVGDGVNLTLRRIALDDEQRVRDRVHRGLEVGHDAWQPGDVLIRSAAEHLAVIIDGVVVIERAQLHEIAAVAGAAIPRARAPAGPASVQQLL